MTFLFLEQNVHNHVNVYYMKSSIGYLYKNEEEDICTRHMYKDEEEIRNMEEAREITCKLRVWENPNFIIRGSRRYHIK